MKRGCPGDHLPDSKKLKDAISALYPIQEKIRQLDEECAKEQIKVQRQFATQLRPLFADRQQLLKDIPYFWGGAIENIPLPDMIFCDRDKDILRHLEEVDVEDNIDERGSYRITFKFGPGSSEWFTPSTITKTVTFSEDEVGEPHVEATEIIWTGGKDLTKEMEEKRSAANEEDDDTGFEECSFLEWFTNKMDFDFPPIGDILRREVWQNPLYHILDDDGDGNSDEEENDE